MNILNFTISHDSSVIEALKKIDKNKHSFLLVVDLSNIILGVITEGDIRRYLLKGYSLNSILRYNKEFISVNEDDSFNKLFTFFKSERINFIPILDKNKKVLNVITKKQFHVILLKDMKYNIKDLPIVDENELDYEIFPRPWGFYKSTLLAKHVQSKIITVFPEGELSLQKHKRREEHWIIIKGEGTIVLEDSILKVEEGRYIYIPKGSKHRIVNTSKKENLIFAEVQLGDYFGEDDIIRYYDKYGRLENGI